MNDGAEDVRLLQAREANIPWRKWGPYLSERQWGTVREDYSPDGNAWNYFSHDQARSRAYHWGEDGLAGISDERQHLCLSVALVPDAQSGQIWLISAETLVNVPEMFDAIQKNWVDRAARNIA